MVLGGSDGMVDDSEAPHISAQDARAGSTPHMTRYILAVSMILVIALFALLLLG
jgi:hypothetical protein